jgi:hypothetical protein
MEHDDGYEDLGPFMALLLVIGLLGGLAAFIYAVCFTLNHFGVI